MAGEYHGECNGSWIDGDNNLVSCSAGDRERKTKTEHTSFDE